MRVFPTLQHRHFIGIFFQPIESRKQKNENKSKKRSPIKTQRWHVSSEGETKLFDICMCCLICMHWEKGMWLWVWLWLCLWILQIPRISFLLFLTQTHTHTRAHAHCWKGSPAFSVSCFNFLKMHNIVFVNSFFSMHDLKKWKMFQIDTLENLFLFLSFLFFPFLFCSPCSMNNWCVCVGSLEWNTHSRIFLCEEKNSSSRFELRCELEVRPKQKHNKKSGRTPIGQKSVIMIIIFRIASISLCYLGSLWQWDSQWDLSIETHVLLITFNTFDIQHMILSDTRCVPQYAFL